MSPPPTLLITDDYLPHVGGSRIYYHRVASILAGELAVLTARRGGAGEFDAALTYPICRVNLRASTWTRLRSLAEALDCVKLAWCAATRFPSVRSYLAGELNPSAIAAWMASRLTGAPFGVILHDEPLSGSGRLESALRRRILRKAAVIIVSCGFAAGRARDIVGDRVPVFNVPPGVDSQVFSPGAADPSVLERYGVREGDYLLSVGRLVDYKNVSAVIDTVAALRDAGLRLLIVGEGPDKSALESRVLAASLQNRILFAGKVPTGDLVHLYRAALAFVFPSRPSHGRQHEGVGMAMLEAAACGCLVIASTATSAADFVTDGVTGFLFDPLDKDALTPVVRAVLDSPQAREKISLEAAQTVRRRFRWQNTAEVFQTALRTLTSRTAE